MKKQIITIALGVFIGGALLALGFVYVNMTIKDHNNLKVVIDFLNKASQQQAQSQTPTPSPSATPSN